MKSDIWILPIAVSGVGGENMFWLRDRQPAICPLEACELIITDKGSTDEMIAPYVKRGVKVHRV